MPRKKHSLATKLSDLLQEQNSTAKAVLEPLQKQVQALQRASRPFRQTTQALQNLTEAHAQQIRIIEEAAKRQAETNKKLFEEFNEWIKQIPARDKERQEAAEKLVEVCWFFDPDMAWYAPHEIACAIDEGRLEEVEKALSDYFQSQLDVIKQRLKVANPHRANILCDAFDAHREKKYNLSVPVFLTQADGIWWDRFSKSVFMRDDRKNAAADFMLKAKEDCFKSLMSLFQGSAPLWQSESERDSSFDELNRHQILHGEVVGYGTEVNSLKAISFLNFLCWMLESSPQGNSK